MALNKNDIVAVEIVNNLATNPKRKVQEAKGNKEALALFSQFMGEAMENNFLQNYTVTLTLKDGTVSSFDLIDGAMIAHKSPPA